MDFRSDTVTRPDKAMLEAMRRAKVGDDVYRDDPGVIALEAKAAELTGKEAAMYAVSGTQSNLCALLAHAGRGDEVLVGNKYHSYVYEGGGMAVLGGIFPCAIAVKEDGTLDPGELAAAIKPNDSHHAVTTTIALENTHNGKPIAPEYFCEVRKLAKKHALGMHLDGARLFHAVSALGVPLRGFTDVFDSVSLCLSKGLGAPMGSVLVGSEEHIARARRWRKVLGGGYRQGGYMAAAGMVALTENTGRLEEDHRHAASLAGALAGCTPLVEGVDYTGTNMLFARINPRHAQDFHRHMRDHGVLLGSGNPVRVVCHKDVSSQDCTHLIELIRAFALSLEKAD